MKNFTFLLFCLLFAACVSEVAVENTETAPPVTEADEAFADVFKPMEGKWVGEFKVFEDLRPSERNLDLLNEPTKGYLRTPSMTLLKRAKVEHTYTSESPYFQKVSTREVFYSEAGEVLETLDAKGVQKVQNGQLYAVMQHKVDSLVILNGKQIGNKLAWQRASLEPSMQEYFEHHVQKDLYEVLGFAYHDGDDRKKMPRFWYYGRYDRVE